MSYETVFSEALQRKVTVLCTSFTTVDSRQGSLLFGNDRVGVPGSRITTSGTEGSGLSFEQAMVLNIKPKVARGKISFLMFTVL